MSQREVQVEAFTSLWDTRLLLNMVDCRTEMLGPGALAASGVSTGSSPL